MRRVERPLYMIVGHFNLERLIMQERWKNVPGSNYACSSLGRIRNNNNLKILKPSFLKQKKSCRYRVAFAGKNWMLHTLIYKVFNDVPLDEPVRIFFVDGDARNVSADNLSVVDPDRFSIITEKVGEEWRDILGISGYKVSNFARISREINGVNYLVKIVTHKKRPWNGEREYYLAFGVPRSKHAGNTWMSVKKAVSTAFCLNNAEKSHIYHVDGDYKNCLPCNLRHIKKFFTVDESILKIQKSCVSNTAGAMAALSIMASNDATLLNRYIEEKYSYLQLRAKQMAMSLGCDIFDSDDALNDTVIEIGEILKKGNYTGKAPLAHFICGVIKNRLKCIREIRNKDISCFGVNKDGDEFFIPDIHFHPWLTI